MERDVGVNRAKDYMSALDRKLIPIHDTKELKEHLLYAYTDAYARALRNLFSFMEFQKEIESFNDISIEKWKKSIKLRRSGVREIYVSDNELREAYLNTDEEIRILFKLLSFSGVRFIHALEGMKRLSDIVTKGDLCRIPINSLTRGNKRVFWIYFPKELFRELEQFPGNLNFYTYQKRVRYKRVCSSSIRKWHLNFMIQNNVPESIADFIQGRASVTVGSTHYLAKTQLADSHYSRIIPMLLDVL